MNELICIDCSTRHSIDSKIWKCECGGLLDIEHNSSFPIVDIGKRKPDMWRYREAIPVSDDENIISFGEGFTPLLEVNISGRTVLIKQDHIMPTGSFKDRGASVLLSKIKELGIRNIVEDSSGNAGAAIAAYAAKAGVDCEIFVPSNTSSYKLKQIESYGAHLSLINGTREDTSGAALKEAEKIYYASHSWNPFFLQGTKTIAYEICEQLGWKSPDSIVLPVGNGSLLLGVYIGFNELKNCGIVSKIPKLIAVQAEACAPLFLAFNKKFNNIPEIKKGTTIAEGIAVANPIRGSQIISAVHITKGEFLIVSEKDIKKSLIKMYRKGFYIEPTSAVAISGITKYLTYERKSELIVSIFTGHGLKVSEKFINI